MSTGRTLAVSALAGACLVGAVVAVGAMWATRPTRVIERRVSTASTPLPVVTASFSPDPLPTERLADELGPSLASVRVRHDEEWSTGTGVWLDGEGTLLTATPLVVGATSVLVTGRDGVARPAQVAGSDPATAVTALAVSRTSGIPLAATSSPVRSGQLVAIIGAPGSVPGGGQAASEATMTTTVVRAPTMRVTLGGLVLHDAIELDRSMPDDAIGGAVVDGEGHLAGIALGHGADDSGIVIPADDALSAGRALRDHGRVQRAWLGVQAVDLDPGVATVLEVPGGARVTAVTDRSPAEAAGLRTGDVIVRIGRHRVQGASDLVVELRARRPGERVVCSVSRDGDRRDIPLTLGG